MNHDNCGQQPIPMSAIAFNVAYIMGGTVYIGSVTGNIGAADLYLFLVIPMFDWLS